jgi:hypothetical protein
VEGHLLLSLDIEGVGEIGQLIIREAAYRVCSMDPPHPAEKWERKLWATRPLIWCYENAGTILRAFPRARIRK